jgi:hypothetical protein
MSKSRPLNSEEIIKEILSAAQSSYLEIPLKDKPNSLPNKEIFRIFDDIISKDGASIKNKAVLKSAQIIHEKITLLQKYRYDHGDFSKETEKFERFITNSTLKLVRAIEDFVTESLKHKMTSTSPSWMMPIEYGGVASIKSGESFELVTPSKTTGSLIFKKRAWESRRLESDIGFITGVVNCNTRDISNRTVSMETLEGASPDDLEVFDSIHEMDRIYSDSTFGLGIIKINKETLEIESDNDLRSLILEHVAQEKSQKENASSLSLFIISESYNIAKNGINSVPQILQRIPFEDLRNQGIDEINLDFVSCNTAEIATSLISESERIAKDHGISIKTNFHNGYIFNNITYCYVAEHDYRKCFETNQIPESLIESDDEKPKKPKLVQIVIPGFSNIFAGSTSELNEYSVTRSVGEGGKAPKKLLKNIDKIKFGQSFTYHAEGRFLARSQEEIQDDLQKSFDAFEEKLREIENPLEIDSPKTTPTKSHIEKMIQISGKGSFEI